MSDPHPRRELGFCYNSGAGVPLQAAGCNGEITDPFSRGGSEKGQARDPMNRLCKRIAPEGHPVNGSGFCKRILPDTPGGNGRNALAPDRRSSLL